MGWLVVAFDLPVGSKKQRKAASDFRNYLLDDGFQMMQFSDHRLIEADGLQTEPLDTAPIDFYRPSELRALLEHSSIQMRPIIVLQALGGLRLQEALRLDWREVFGIAGHIEISSSKSKTRQRRLVVICPALEKWLASYRGKKGNVATQTLPGYTKSLTALRRSLKIPPRRNGLA